MIIGSRARTLSPLTILLPLAKVQQRLCTVALPSHTTLLSLSQHFLYSPSNSFLQFQMVYCCYVKEALNDLYCSPNIVRMIKSRRMRWAGHVARMGEERGCIGSWWGNRRERDNWGDLGVDGWIILGWISRRWDMGI